MKVKQSSQMSNLLFKKADFNNFSKKNPMAGELMWYGPEDGLKFLKKVILKAQLQTMSLRGENGEP